MRRYDSLQLTMGDDTDAMTPVAQLIQDARDLAEAGRSHEAYEKLAATVSTVQDIGFDDVSLEIIDDFRLEVPDALFSNADAAWIANYEGLAMLRLGHIAEAKTAFDELLKCGTTDNDKDMISTALLNLGNAASSAGEYDKSRTLYAECARIKTEIRDDLGTVQVLLNMAQLDLDTGNVGDASKLLDAVETVARGWGEPRAMIGVSFHRAHISAISGDLTIAESCYREALKYARRSLDLYTEIKALQNIGKTFLDRSLSGRALRWLRRARALAETLGNNFLLGPIDRILANALHQSGRLIEAEAHFELARNFALSAGSTHDWATDTANLGALRLLQNDPKVAFSLLDESLITFVDEANIEWQLRTLQNMHGAARLLNEAELLESIGTRMLALIPIDDHLERSTILRKTGEALADIGADGDVIAPWLQRALDEQATSDIGNELGWNIALAGAIMSENGWNEWAVTFFDRAKAFYITANDNHLLFRTRNDLGLALARLNRLSEAQSELVWCLDTSRQLQDRAMEIQASLNLGELFRRMGNFDQSRTHHENALFLAREMEDKSQLADALCAHGHFLCDTGDFSGASNAYNESLALVRFCGDNLTKALSIRGLGNCHYSQGRFARARSAYNKALLLFEKDNDATHTFETLASLASTLAARNDQERMRSTINRVVELATDDSQVPFVLQMLYECSEWLLQRGQYSDVAEIYAAYLYFACHTLSVSNDESARVVAENVTRLVLQANGYTDSAVRARFWRPVSQYLKKNYSQYGILIARLVTRLRKTISQLEAQPPPV